MTGVLTQNTRPLTGYAGILIVCLALVVAIARNTGTDIEQIRHHYLENSAATASKGAREVDRAFRSIYENLRTLAALPSVRDIDRHATNLDADGKMTIQQVYNSLATSVAVSWSATGWCCHRATGAVSALPPARTCSSRTRYRMRPWCRAGQA